MTHLYGSLEAGGTKFVCAVGNADLEVVAQTQFPTTSPAETLAQTIAFFQQFEGLEALAIGSFGPIDVDPSSPTYGYVTKTPKPNWSQTDLVGPLREALGIPIYFTTDVNSSAYGEVMARPGVTDLVYYTIGTGIGGGAYANGGFIGGIGHTEMGHSLMGRHPEEGDFEGTCPFHKNCLEGLAAGPSLEARTGIRGEHIPLDSDVWDKQAHYIAQAAIQATVMFRPQVIVFGGGVMAQAHMLQRVRDSFARLFNDYLPLPALEDYLVTPMVSGNGSATLGNLALARELVAPPQEVEE